MAFDKLIDSLVSTPLARRLLAGYLERGLLSLCMLAAGYAHLQAGTFENDAAKLAAEAAPLLVALIFGLIAQARMKKTELTIEQAHQAQPEEPRAVIDARVRTLIAWPPQEPK